ncbi:hypothetical protein CXG81DRAFT_13646, partial [Caulochytrium protostelioides]
MAEASVKIETDRLLPLTDAAAPVPPEAVAAAAAAAVPTTAAPLPSASAPSAGPPPSAPPSVKEDDASPDDDPLKVPDLTGTVWEAIAPAYYAEPGGIPVFEPTEAQFSDFYRFMLAVEAYGYVAGVIKITPPAAWTAARRAIIPRCLERVRVRNPISQEISSGGLPAGTYQQLNLESRKSYTLQEWANASRLPRHCKNRPNKNKHRVRPNKNAPVALAPFTFDVDALGAHYDDATCEALERAYWRSLSHGAPRYGADMSGTLFDPDADAANPWNIGKLDNLLTRVQRALPGVNRPYLYFGMWKATFAWHVEDMDLFSINYIHFGAPKQWYVIPLAQRARFEREAKSFFSGVAAHCPEFLRHKMSIIHPRHLAARGIRVQKVIQRAGEFIVTFPGGYHQGFNLGFNGAESVNFALPSWIQVGKQAHYCKCQDDSVKLDVAGLFE